MSKLQKIGAAVLIALLAVAGWGLWATQQSTAVVQAVKTNALLPAASHKSAVPIIDQNTYFTAQHLARLANTPDEQPFAQAAVQVADHELDLAFAAVLRYLEANPPPLSPEATRIQQHLDNLQKVLAADSDSLKRLQAQLAQASDAEKPAIQDRLDLLQSQVDLEQDDPEAKISRKHALIIIEGGKITIEDIGSLNGTYVNRGNRLIPGTPLEIKAGDEVIIGKTFLKLVVDPIS